MAVRNSPAASTTRASATPPGRRGHARALIAIVFLLAAAIALGVALGGGSGGGAHVGTRAGGQDNCAATPSSCGFPDATNTGVQPGTTLRTVPGQVSSGPGWNFDARQQAVMVTGQGAVLSGLYIPCNLNISASGVTIDDVRVVASGLFGVSLRHTSGVTIENSAISGQNATSGRVNSAISDVYGDSTGMVVKNNDISAFRSAVQLTAGLVTGNYIHDPGYIAGDHTNGVIANGGTAQLTVTGNTILDNLDQTDAISLDTLQVPGPVTNKTITGNLLGGGAYTIYGGAAFGHATASIVISNNRFAQSFFPKSGQFGPVAYFVPGAPGNAWSGNVWDDTGKAIPSS